MGESDSGYQNILEIRQWLGDGQSVVMMQRVKSFLHYEFGIDRLTGLENNRVQSLTNHIIETTIRLTDGIDEENYQERVSFFDHNKPIIWLEVVWMFFK